MFKAPETWLSSFSLSFLQLQAGDDKVTIRYGKREWVYDFSELTVK